MSNHDTDGTIQVKVEFRNYEPIQKDFSILDAVDDVRKWAIGHYEGQIGEGSSVYTLLQINPETNQASHIEGNFFDLKDLIIGDIKVLEFRLDKEKHVQG